MPDIDLIPEVLYQPLDPYHHVYDNLPLRGILDRISLVNNATDNNSAILRESVGDQGTLSNRLAQSLNENGTIKPEAVDATEHNIASHSDGSGNVSSDDLTALADLGYSSTNPVSFVRMLEAERAKLANVASGSTSLKVQLPGDEDPVLFDNETVVFENTDTVSWIVVAPNRIQANMAFSPESAHSHVYDVTPVHSNLVSPNYINYKSASVATPFKEDSLRVHVNGTRLSKSAQVHVRDKTSGTWVLTTYTVNPGAGTFALNRALTPTDVIRIDFDISLT